MGNLLSNAANWPFLNEPIYRWGLFFIIVFCFFVAWRGVLRLM